MTLDQFAAANPDLAVNWQRANDPAFANDPNAAWILALGSLENFLRTAAANYGVPITTATGGGTTTTTTGGISPQFDPVHRLQGYTRQGYEVYSLIDEQGRVVEWYDIPGVGATGQHYLASRVDPASYVYTTTRPGSGGGVVTPGGNGSSGGGWDRTAIVVALIGAAGLWFAYRQSGKRS